jgi:hypothetical protein
MSQKQHLLQLFSKEMSCIQTKIMVEKLWEEIITDRNPQILLGNK